MKVLLIGKDGIAHPVEEILIAVQSKVIRTRFKYNDSSEVIDLPSIEGDILKRIIAWVHRPQPETLELDKAAFASTVDRFVAEAGKPEVLRCDNAPDLAAGAFDTAVVRLGIRREQTARNAPHQNAHVERALATLTADARTLLADTGLPRNYWALAMSNACHTRNIIKISQLKGKQATDMIKVCRIPDVSMLRRWGTKAIVHDPKAKCKNKLQMRGVPMVYVGHRIGLLGWIFVNPSTNRLICSRDAIFFEDISGAELLGVDDAAVCDNGRGDDFEWLLVPAQGSTRAALPETTPAATGNPSTRKC